MWVGVGGGESHQNGEALSTVWVNMPSLPAHGHCKPSLRRHLQGQGTSVPTLRPYFLFQCVCQHALPPCPLPSPGRHLRGQGARIDTRRCLGQQERGVCRGVWGEGAPPGVEGGVERIETRRCLWQQERGGGCAPLPCRGCKGVRKGLMVVPPRMHACSLKLVPGHQSRCMPF